MKKQFICAGEALCDFGTPVPAPYLRRVFTLDTLPQKATLRVCGLGFYCLFLNGEEITRGRLSPAISNPDDFCYYDSYEVADCLRAGENAIGILLGNGLMNGWGGSIWNYDKAAWRASPRVALELVADGETLLEADEQFRTHPSPIREDDLRMGEVYDAREEANGWCTTGFDDAGWSPALSAAAPRGVLREYPASPVRVVREHAPVAVTPTANGFLYDFGINTAAIFRLRLKNATRGQTVTLRLGEEKCADGELSRRSVNFGGERHADFNDRVQRDTYIARGDAEEVWEPSFTYHGYRFAEVLGLRPEQATDDLLTMLEEHSDIPDIGGFRCSDEYVNRLTEMVHNSDLSNFVYFPTDCPHREKNGWTGDAALSAERMLTFYDCAPHLREWLFSVRAAQNAEGALPGIVPTGGWGFAWGNGPAWDRALFQTVWFLYRNTGDAIVIEENADAMVKYLRYIGGRRSDDGTVAVGLGDWAPVGNSASHYETPLVLTDSIMVLQMAKQAEKLFAVIGRGADADDARKLAREMREAIRKTLLDRETATLCQGTQTGQALGLAEGVFDDGEETARAVSVLLQKIREKGDRFDCGCLGMGKLFDVLSEYGEGELAYRLAMQEGYPSYRQWIDRGETSLCEGFQPDGVVCGSHNHHFFGDIAGWFFRRVAGIRILSHNCVEIRPQFLSALDFAEGWCELPDGHVFTRWERTKNGCTVSYRCPASISCTVIAPEGTGVRVIKN